LRRAPCPALDDLRQEASVGPLLEHGDPIRALHHLITALHAPFATLVLRLDQRLDELEQWVLRDADDQDLADITAIRHQAAVIRSRRLMGRSGFALQQA
jgi:magnesium transporter